MANEKFQILSCQIMSEIVSAGSSHHSGEISDCRLALISVEVDGGTEVSPTSKVLVFSGTLLVCFATTSVMHDEGCSSNPLDIAQIHFVETSGKSQSFSLEKVESGVFDQEDFREALRKSIQAKAAEMGLNGYCGEITTDPLE